MKKLLVLLLVVFTCFALAACKKNTTNNGNESDSTKIESTESGSQGGGNESSGGGSQGGGNESSGGGSQGGGNESSGGGSQGGGSQGGGAGGQQPIEGEQVADETAWNNALQLTGNFSLINVEDDWIDIDTIYNGIYFRQDIHGDYVLSRYYFAEDEKYYKVISTNYVWEKEEISQIEYEQVTDFSGWFDFDYNEFSWDATKKAYVSTSEYGDTTMSIEVYIKDGKIVRATAEESRDGETVYYYSDVSYTVSEIIIPEIGSVVGMDEIESQKVADADAWAEAFGINGDREMQMLGIMKINGEVVGYINQTATYYNDDFRLIQDQSMIGLSSYSETYYEKNGDNYFAYIVEDGKWVKKDSNKDNYDSMLGVEDMMAIYDYNAFTYDEEKKAYYAASLSDGEVVMVDNYVYIVDGKVKRVISTQGDGESERTVVMYINFTRDGISFTFPEDGSEADFGGNEVGGGGSSVVVKPDAGISNADEWMDAISMPENFATSTITKTNNNESSTNCVVVGDIVRLEIDGVISFYESNDGNYYEYYMSQKDGQWHRRQIDQGQFYQFLVSGLEIYNFDTDVYYDAEENLYRVDAKDLFGMITYTDVEIEFDMGRPYRYKATVDTEEGTFVSEVYYSYWDSEVESPNVELPKDFVVDTDSDIA